MPPLAKASNDPKPYYISSREIIIFCHHNSGALYKRDEYIRIVQASTSVVQRCSKLLPMFSFTIPKNTKNPLEGVVDKNTTMTIMENKDDVKPPPSKVPKLRHMLVIPRGGMFPIELWVEE